MTTPSRIFCSDFLSRFGRDRSGAAKIEYSLIVALVSVGVLSGVNELGMLVYSLFNNTAQSIEQVTDGAAGGSGSNGDSGNGDCGPGNGNGNCGNKGNGGGNTGGSGPGTGNGGSNSGQGQNSSNGGGGKG